MEGTSCKQYIKKNVVIGFKTDNFKWCENDTVSVFSYFFFFNMKHSLELIKYTFPTSDLRGRYVYGKN